MSVTWGLRIRVTNHLSSPHPAAVCAENLIRIDRGTIPVILSL